MKSKIHRCNCREIWSIQNRKTKITASTILLNGKWLAELRPERQCNPRGFVTTNRSQDILVNPDIKFVERFLKQDKLIYDKLNVNFNVQQGKYLYFSEDGTCYILKKMYDNLTED